MKRGWGGEGVGGGSLSTNQLYGDGTVQPPTVQCRRCPHGPPGTTTAVTSTYMSHLHDRFDGGGHEMGGRVYNGVRKRRDVVVTRLLLCGDHVLHHVRAVRLGAVPPVHRRHAVQVATVHGVTRGDTVGVIGLGPGRSQHRVNDPPTNATRTRDDDDTQRASQLDRNAHCAGNNTAHAARRPAFAAHAPWSRPHGARARTPRSCPGQSMFACLQPRGPTKQGVPPRQTDRQTMTKRTGGRFPWAARGCVRHLSSFAHGVGVRQSQARVVQWPAWTTHDCYCTTRHDYDCSFRPTPIL